MTDKCCGTCRYHRKNEWEEWYCHNPESDYYTDYTAYDDSCYDWEERGEKAPWRKQLK